MCDHVGMRKAASEGVMFARWYWEVAEDEYMYGEFSPLFGEVEFAET